MNNEQVLLAKYPKGMPQDDTFKYENIDIVDPKKNDSSRFLCGAF